MRKFFLTLSALFFLLISVNAQTRTLTGTVTDDNGNSIANVTVLVKGTKIGTATKSDGSFSINVPASAKTLVFSSIGKASQEMAIGSESNISLQLKNEDKSLEEIVVVGYEVKKKKDVTGATASLKGKDIANRPVGSFAKAMQGELPGVQVIANNGVPGGNVTVNIRGVGSINASTTPLFIVDGVQMVSGNPNRLNFGNGPETSLSTNLLNSLNPNDIESIDVLKDPASASIYGAQAANGVVIITTKKGKNGKSRVGFNTFNGISTVIKKLDVLNATEFTQLGYEAYVNRYGAASANTTTFLGSVGNALNLGRSVTVTNGKVEDLPSTDWQDIAFRNGFVQNYDLSVSGGNEKTSFFLSGGFNNLKGHVIASDFKRGSFRANIDHKISSKFSVGTSLSLSTYTQNGVDNGGGFGNPVRDAFLSAPINSVYLPDGTFRSASNGTWFGGIDNLLSYTTYNVRYANTKSLIGGVNVLYRFNNDLSFRTTFSLNYDLNNERAYDDPRYSGAPTGSVVRVSRQITDFQTNQVLNYNHAFGKTGKHNVTGLLGVEYRSDLDESFSASANTILYQFQTLSAAAIADKPSETFNNFRLLGQFVKLGYSYNNKYYVNFTLRRDGSSRFGTNNQYGYFPAIAAAWRVTDENFFSNRFRDHNDIKLRLSYGKTGNQAGIGVYAARALVGLSGEYMSVGGLAPSQLPNPDLSWEENETYNAGADINLFDKRVILEVDAFISNRNKLLLNVPLPTTSGFGSITKNAGVLRNRGIEAGITTINLRSRNFKWTSTLNVSYVKNNVISLAEGQTKIGTAIIIGRPLNAVFTYNYAGVNPADGRPFYYDTLGNPTYVPQLRDRYYLDRTLDPTYFGAFTNTFTYKDFDLRVQLSFSGGNYIQNSDASFLQRAGSTTDRNQAKSQLDRWQKPGDVTKVPKPYFGGTQPGASSNSFFSNRFYEKGDFARIKEVTLNYNFNKSLIKKFGMSSGSFYISGYNLYTWTKYSMFDPEVKDFDFGQYPQARQVIMGLNIGL